MLLTEQPKTFVIALKDHPVSQQQLQDCLTSAEKFNWHVEIFWGIDGRYITDQIWKDEGIFVREDKPTMDKPGARGCFLSHWFLWKKCVELNEPIIILEHDALIQYPWKPLEISTHLIKLHSHYSKKRFKFDEDSGNWTKSGHAYCLLPTHAEKLIKFTREVGAFANDMMIGDKVLDYTHMNEYVTRQNTYSTTGEL